MADEIEEHARDLFAQARKLQRMADRMSAAGDRPARGPGQARGRTTSRGSERPETRGGTGGEKAAGGPKRPPKGGESSPAWAPAPRKRRT